MRHDTLSREPVLQDSGRIYCSPACGVKCTKAQHDESLRLGAELAARLGPGWFSHVWENGRWHYSATRKDTPIGVYPSPQRWHGRQWHEEGVDEYTVYLNTEPQIITRNTDPVEAVKQAAAELKEHVGQLQETLNTITSQPS